MRQWWHLGENGWHKVTQRVRANTQLQWGGEPGRAFAGSFPVSQSLIAWCPAWMNDFISTQVPWTGKDHPVGKLLAYLSFLPQGTGKGEGPGDGEWTVLSIKEQRLAK